MEDRGSLSPLLGDGGYDEHTYEAWWKKRAALWCVQARQANTLWSIALAAAVMGLVILGHRWQHERCQNQQLRLQLCAKDEVHFFLTWEYKALLIPSNCLEDVGK